MSITALSIGLLWGLPTISTTLPTISPTVFCADCRSEIAPEDALRRRYKPDGKIHPALVLRGKVRRW
jgi:hypothetical protein